MMKNLADILLEITEKPLLKKNEGYDLSDHIMDMFSEVGDFDDSVSIVKDLLDGALMGVEALTEEDPDDHDYQVEPKDKKKYEKIYKLINDCRNKVSKVR